MEANTDVGDFAEQVRKCRERFEEEKKAKIHERYQKIIADKDERLIILERTLAERDRQLKDAVEKLLIIQREVQNNLEGMKQLQEFKHIKSENTTMREELRITKFERDNLLNESKK